MTQAPEPTDKLVTMAGFATRGDVKSVLRCSTGAGRWLMILGAVR
jgi:hypothetical protein